MMRNITLAAIGPITAALATAFMTVNAYAAAPAPVTPAPLEQTVLISTHINIDVQTQHKPQWFVSVFFGENTRAGHRARRLALASAEPDAGHDEALCPEAQKKKLEKTEANTKPSAPVMTGPEPMYFAF